MIISKKRNRLLLTSKILGVVGIVVLFIGGGISLWQYFSNKTELENPPVSEPVNNANDPPQPDIKKPATSEFENYQVAPNLPRYIFISKLSLRAIVKPLGLTKDNHLKAPVNIYDAGWFNQSAQPGKAGAMVIDGHVGWRTKPGIFHELKVLKPEDTITIVRGDGVTIMYKVVTSKSYDAAHVDMATALAPVNPNKPGLNLITCDGNVVKTNEYDKRLVIFAEQM